MIVKEKQQLSSQDQQDVCVIGKAKVIQKHGFE